LSLLVAVLPNLPGFLDTVKIIDATSVSAFFVRLYDYAWFVGFAIAFAIYLALRGLSSEIKRDASIHSTFAQGRLSLRMTKE
jgi:cytosine/uracil/thiamine/allantoin permease